jgi:hypothetical protein
MKIDYKMIIVALTYKWVYWVSRLTGIIASCMFDKFYLKIDPFCTIIF